MINKRYTPADIEDKWYQHWMNKNYFHSTPDEREPFTIVIPPPNVTGVLHMGHILNNTIQDILIRKARMDGKNACWVPGMDHASIATEAKVVGMLREKGIKKSDLTRDEFLEYAWNWKEKYGGIILKQLQKLGASCDWERTAFTMDETRSEAVLEVFIDLFHKGKLYRGLRMINWDPEAKTVLSNEEVIYHEEETDLYYVKYQVVDESGNDTGEWLTIATTRPETILGDTAIAVHPDDPRYAHMKGKFAIVPLVNRQVPIIFDDYVDIEFGTGALKITPAHDPNDYEIGQKHGLETIDVLNDDGTISDAGILFVGMDRMDARVAATRAIDELGQLEKLEKLVHNVGRSERTNAFVEPKLSLQWFVDMKAIAAPALEAVLSDEVKFFPENLKNTYRHWIENIRDWCISRQLWWGQRIPAYYLIIDGEEKVIVSKTRENALVQAKEQFGAHIQDKDLRQEEDVVDTWFSSWLWPISVFDGFHNEEEINYYYPTSVLVTGWDIIFLWVARMVMAGYEWRDEKPFNHVYFTGMVRDKQHRKMSKQLGNSPDALKLIEEYGADGVRFGIMYSSPAGGDLLFDNSHVEQGRNFCNKIWNALKLVKGWETDSQLSTSAGNELAMEWFESISQKVIQEVDTKLNQYRLSEGLVLLYKYVWNDFCSSYLEMIKPKFGERIDQKTLDQTVSFFERICTLLHPYMPFITEEVWHRLKDRADGEDCILSAYPTFQENDISIQAQMNTILDVKTKILEIRNVHQVSFKEPLGFGFVSNGGGLPWESQGAVELLIKLTNVSTIQKAASAPEQSLGFVSGKTTYFVELSKEVDFDAELEKLEKDKAYYEGFVQTVHKKLSNERFVQNAPQQVVEKEKKKLADGLSKIEQLTSSISELRNRMGE
jgi:valyl-tRNA synthetase